MTRTDAEKIITEYMKPIFGFALKRCRDESDAEDLSQEIVLRAYRALLIKNDIADAGKFIWTVAHNSLANYYRVKSKAIIGIAIDEVSESLADDTISCEENEEALIHLRNEIAYLSKERRKIIIDYYFNGKKQSDIASSLGIPLGTVKWHLFEAKKELKKGMDTMRKTSDLKFNPIKFSAYGINGSGGTSSINEYLHSTLAQNICYDIRSTAKTVNEIADDLGVSPVYVETEIEHLEGYGLLKAEKDKYISDFIIEEPSAQLLITRDKLYKKAAELFANELYDELTVSGIIDDKDILCGQTDGSISMSEAKRADRNFILWSLIPYIAARSGEKLTDDSVKFEEAATIRPDGGNNIVHAIVGDDNIALPDDYVPMTNWCGPMILHNADDVFWQVNSKWTDRASPSVQYFNDAGRILSLYSEDNEIPKYDYAWLCEMGYVKVCGDYDGSFKASWQIVQLCSCDINKRLLDIGDRIREKNKAEFDRLKAPYIKAVLDSLPKHIRRKKEYGLQFMFSSDGWFLLHCISCLLKNGKLKEPTEEQRKVLSTIIMVSTRE